MSSHNIIHPPAPTRPWSTWSAHRVTRADLSLRPHRLRPLRSRLRPFRIGAQCASLLTRVPVRGQKPRVAGLVTQEHQPSAPVATTAAGLPPACRPMVNIELGVKELLLSPNIVVANCPVKGSPRTLTTHFEHSFGNHHAYLLTRELCIPSRELCIHSRPLVQCASKRQTISWRRRLRRPKLAQEANSEAEASSRSIGATLCAFKVVGCRRRSSPRPSSSRAGGQAPRT